MKIEMTKEECLKYAELEGDAEIGAGVLSALPFEGFDPATELQKVIKFCASKAKTPGCGRPRWSVVGSITGHGCGYSRALCRWAGVEPDERVVVRR